MKKTLFTIFITISFINAIAQMCSSKPLYYPAGTNPLSLTNGDFNGDGKIDLATTYSTLNKVAVMLGDGLGGFGSPALFNATGAGAIACADFNADGKSDLAVANSNSNYISILLGTGTGSFGIATTYTTTAGSTCPYSIVSVDLNHDGKMDLATANYCSSGGVSILLGTGTGSFGSATTFTAGAGAGTIIYGDFNNDSNIDLAVANHNASGNNNVSLLIGNGAGGFTSSFIVSTSGQAYSINKADFNADGKMDLIVGWYNGTLSLLTGTGTGSFNSPVYFTVGSYPKAIACADFNGDGKKDIATTGYYTGAISVLIGNGGGNFATALNIPVGNNPFDITSADFNTDGYDDIAMAIPYKNEVAILMGGKADSLSGNILISGTPVSSGKIYLKNSRNGVNSIDTTTLVSNIVNGAFAYPNLPYGNYYLKAVANVGSYPNSIPTYYSNKANNYKWDSAVVIKHLGCTGLNQTGNNISVIQIVQQAGQGIISGSVTALASYGHKWSSTSNIMAAAKGVDIKLGKRPAGGCTNRTTTDNTGHYTFNNVDTGNYFVFVDIPNYIDTIANVHVTTTNLTFYNVNYCVDSVNVHFCGSLLAGIQDLTDGNEGISIYPNPNNGILNITFATRPENMILEVYNSLGALVIKKELGELNSMINISEVYTGLYFVKVQQNNKVIAVRKIMKE